MKKYISYVLFLLSIISCTLISSCTDEENNIDFVSFYKNETGTSLSIFGYAFGNELQFEYVLNNDESSPICKTQSPSFLGANCRADSIVFVFQNSKGYICTDRPTGNSLCFQMSPLIGEESHFNEIEPNTFEFVITQEDFENAFELPE